MSRRAGCGLASFVSLLEGLFPRLRSGGLAFGGFVMVGRAAIDVLLEEVRSSLDRVDPADLALL